MHVSFSDEKFVGKKNNKFPAQISRTFSLSLHFLQKVRYIPFYLHFITVTTPMIFIFNFEKKNMAQPTTPHWISFHGHNS